jgi:hypothetical protein
MAAERFRASLWERQERWKFKREVYERLLGSLADFGLANHMLTLGKASLGEDMWKQLTERERKAMDEVTRLTPVGAMFLGRDALLALDDFYKLGQAATSGPDWRENRDRTSAVLKRTQELLIAAGKRDLAL